MLLKKETVQNLGIRGTRLMVERYESEMIRTARDLSRSGELGAKVLGLLMSKPDVLAEFERYVPDVIRTLRAAHK